MKVLRPPYDDIDSAIQDVINGMPVLLLDHMNGFDAHGNNHILHRINNALTGSTRKIWHVQILDRQTKSRYPNLDIQFAFQLQHRLLWKPFENYRLHPAQQHKNFVCSFNGTEHVSRKMLVAILNRMHWFNPMTCSKNFKFTTDQLDGHLGDYLEPDQHRFYRLLFVGNDSEEFFGKIYSFGHVRFDHKQNIYNLEHKLAGSFLNLVSECLATSYCPFVSEKFLYSVVTRGLFVTYAQPGWHNHLEEYYGFRRYGRIFDYRFDMIQNPVERLVELISMISKFSLLSADDWRDLYEMEKDTLEYNYDWYFTGAYIKHLEDRVLLGEHDVESN